MIFKSLLIVASLAQLMAAALALRINFRYRIYSAWFLLSAAASVGAILRLTSLSEIWNEAPSLFTNGQMWLSALASLLASILLLAGMAMIEPFFSRLSEAETVLRQEHHRMSSIVKETEAELRLAQRIQQRLLPTQPPQVPGVDIAGLSLAADWTSGDYFDYLQLRDGQLALVIADVSGHGLGPALLMSSIRASLRGLASTLDDVGTLLSRGNAAVNDSVSDREFVTAFAVQFEPQQRLLRYAGAGHVAHWMRRGSVAVMLNAAGPPLGVLPDLTIQAQVAGTVEDGDILVLVTDGILESRGPNEEMFGEQRLLSTVEEFRDQPAQIIVDRVVAAARQFSTGSQQDDITVVIAKFDSGVASG